jgi:hypothetical protein
MNTFFRGSLDCVALLFRRRKYWVSRNHSQTFQKLSAIKEYMKKLKVGGFRRDIVGHKTLIGLSLQAKKKILNIVLAQRRQFSLLRPPKDKITHVVLAAATANGENKKKIFNLHCPAEDSHDSIFPFFVAIINSF